MFLKLFVFHDPYHDPIDQESKKQEQNKGCSDDQDRRTAVQRKGGSLHPSVLPQ